MMRYSDFTPKPKRTVIIAAWANIAVQSLLPISLSLSPAVYAAMAENKQRTDVLVVYQVQIGDTALSIAKQFGLTLEELKKLNSEAYKEKSLNAITVGDSLLVPDLRLGERKPAHSIAVKMERDPVDAEKFVAQAATTLASGSAVSSLRSVAVSQANQSVEEWLKRYGTAKVSINVDSDFNLADSEADLLVGLNDTPETFSFTQLGLRHKEDRTTVNAGVGQRHFNAQDKDMLGYNLFLDHEIEAGHTRIGVGAEYWRDYVKLSANGYLRLSGWKASDELVDYDERAANGFDLRAEAYLPSLPQLGGKLKYEQYFGNEVALSDVNNRQKDPYAMTAGINYTPIPLVTVGVDYTKEKGQSGDTQFNLAFNYRLGESVDKQLDSASVAEYRSLAGSRYDLVDRNNNIVLEYRKQELLKLDLADAYRAPEKTEQQVEIAISSKYAIDRIEWQGREFFAAGGSMPVKVTDRIYKVTLPAYRAEGINSYPLSAVAVDVKGNQSNTDTTQIDVTAVSIDRPEISNLRINGVVELGSPITASYEWQPHNGDPVDKSLHQWGHQGKTAALDNATEISTSGTVPPYTVTAGDVGQVLEVSVKAKNGQGVEGNALTIDTTQQYAPEIKPEIEDLVLEGMLNIGNRLTATYRFDPKMGEPTDRSQYQWGHAGKTEALSQRQVISTSGRVESPTLSAS
ncbi:MAG: inverse autotransporter beta domain-containing protein, partial [Plesiomonas sp.]|uniref:inverse autotransporter beta domain-containing protein n=1 Tax=Plesiomonas sp. TaxID=2486279 RepID=UPI003F356FF4